MPQEVEETQDVVLAHGFDLSARLQRVLEEQHAGQMEDDLFDEGEPESEESEEDSDDEACSPPTPSNPSGSDGNTSSRPLSPNPLGSDGNDLPQSSSSMLINTSESKKRRPCEGNKRRKRGQLEQERREKDGPYTNPAPRPKANAKYSKMAMPIFTEMDLSAADVTSTGFTGMREPAIEEELEGVGYEGTRRMLDDKRVYTLEELVGEGSVFRFNHIKWDGKTPMPLVDMNGLLFGVAGGKPENAKWYQEQLAGAQKMAEARKISSNSKTDQTPRRGEFKTMRGGVSHGGGQPHPMNLKNTGRNLKAIERLNGDRFFRTLAGFTSSVFQHWAPKLHKHYNEELCKLFNKDTTLKPTFETVFTATTYNLGPQTTCFPHTDAANLAYGWCSVTALGNFKHETGGQLVLWECVLVIDFPPGSTILFTSALIHHSNTPVGPKEERYSFTQYTAGALFRWVAHNFEKVEDHRKSLDSKELAALDKLNSERWAYGVSLAEKVELVADKVDNA